MDERGQRHRALGNGLSASSTLQTLSDQHDARRSRRLRTMLSVSSSRQYQTTTRPLHCILAAAHSVRTPKLSQGSTWFQRPTFHRSVPPPPQPRPSCPMASLLQPETTITASRLHGLPKKASLAYRPPTFSPYRTSTSPARAWPHTNVCAGQLRWRVAQPHHDCTLHTVHTVQ